MADLAKKLLDNVLGSLDRLFDGHSAAIDVWHLVFATAQALRDTEHYGVLIKSSKELATVVRSGLTPEEEQNLALFFTHELRLYLANLPPGGSSSG